MNLGNDPADQLFRFTLEGTEMALKLSGIAAKHFATFVYAVLTDKKKSTGKTHLTRMLREQKPFKFFTIPSEQAKNFAKDAKQHGLLFVPIVNKQKPKQIEMAVFADDATKVERVMNNLNLDYVKAEAGEAAFLEDKEQEQTQDQAAEKQSSEKAEAAQGQNSQPEFETGGFDDSFSVPEKTEAVQDHTEQPEFELGDFSDHIPASSTEGVVNFTQDGEKGLELPSTEKNPSELSSPSKSSSTDSRESRVKPSVVKQLRDIKEEQQKKQSERRRTPQRQHHAPGRHHRKQKNHSRGR